MGLRGPARKPTALRMLHGDEKRRINQREPNPQPGVADAHESMSDEARKEYEHFGRLLDHAHMISEVDQPVLEVMCNALVDYRNTHAQLNTSAVLVKSTRGTIMPNPLVKLSRDQAHLVLTAAKLLGCTPAVRAAMQLPEDEVDDVERLFA